MIYFDKETKDLIKKFNNMPLVWEEDNTGFKFTATYSEVLEAFIEFSDEFERECVVTLESFFQSLPLDQEVYSMYKRIHPDINFDAGWNYECFASYGYPIIDAFISHKIEKQHVIFVIQLGHDSNYGRYPCDSVLDCMAYCDDCPELEA